MPDGKWTLALVLETAVVSVVTVFNALFFLLGMFVLGWIDKTLRAFGPRASRRLQESVDPEAGEIPVRAIYRTAEWSVVLGAEDGALALVEGWLVFRGERTDWSVRREDVQANFADGDVQIGYSVGEGFAELRLTPLAPWGRGIGRRDSARLSGMYEAWWKGRAVGDSMFPPATAAPEVYRTHRVPWGSPGGAGLCVGVVAACALGFVHVACLIGAAVLGVALLIELRQRAEDLSALGPPRELGEGAGGTRSP